MNPLRLHAVRVGVRRGWTEYVHSLRSGQDQWFYVVVGTVLLVVLWFNRDSEVPGTGLTYPVFALPGFLAGVVVFNNVVGPAFAMAMEKEDGTLLRARATPHGLTGYVAGQVVLHGLGLLTLLGVVLVPSLVLFPDVVAAGGRWWLLLLVLPLGVLATLPLGLLLGAVAPSVQKVSTFGMLPVVAVLGVSGLVVPVQSLWGWVQVVAQALPPYWIGLGMRAALLPDSAAAGELYDSWRLWGVVGVPLLWAVVLLVLLPRVLRRMSRRQSGAAVAEAQRNAAQFVR